MKARLLVFSLLVLPGLVDAQNPTVEAQARAWLDQGEVSRAVTALKAAIESRPDLSSLPLRTLLAQAYLKAGNDAWALRTLSDAARMAPGDCEPWLLMAWIHIRQGALDQAREDLSSAHCAAGSPAETRSMLLSAMVERHAGARGLARERLSLAREASQAFPEDRKAVEQLTRSLDPGRLPAFSGRLDLNSGWTSNVLAGSPTDPASSAKDVSSPAGQAALWLRWVPPLRNPQLGFKQWLQPSLETQVKASGYSEEAGRDYSTLTLSGRPALTVGGASPRLLLAFRYEASVVAGGDRYLDAPFWFYVANRGEFEAAFASAFTVFGGAGRRNFREIGRSRTEVDGGVADGFDLGSRVHLVGALTARRYVADKPPYDLWGGSFLFSADIALWARWALRTGALASMDDYPRSAGYFDAAKPKTARRDQSWKLSAALLGPSWAGHLQPSLAYEYTRRSSTLKAYEYQDHRVFLKLALTFSAGSRLPRPAAPGGRLPLDYGLGADRMDDQVQDLLRQDEAMQRGSTCLD